MPWPNFEEVHYPTPAENTRGAQKSRAEEVAAERADEQRYQSTLALLRGIPGVSVLVVNHASTNSDPEPAAPAPAHN
jgi:hypothetical protein